MLTLGATTLASWEVESLRRALAPILTFTRRYHRQAYCVSTLPTEIGAFVKPFRDDDLTLPAFIVERNGRRIVRLNHDILDTPLAPVALVHECTHHLIGHRRTACTHKIESRHERDVWLASALVAVSRELAMLVVNGMSTVTEIAERCRVPEPLVMIRIALLWVLGERRGEMHQALDMIRYWLGRLESWIDSVKAWLCRRAAVPA